MTWIMVKRTHPEFEKAPHFINFWTKGNGKELKDWSHAELSFKNFEKFAPLYHSTDQLGDDVINEVFLNKSFHEAFALVNNYINHQNNSNENPLPESVNKLLNSTESIPEWVDWNAIEKGAELCRKASLNSLMTLRDYSLMGGYDYAYLNKPLIFTGALKKGAVKRLSDTLEFWVKVTRKNALKPLGEGYKYCLKTRLIHSYSRAMIKKNSPNWNFDKWGEPINTWDMCATYIGFSLVFLHGLHKLKIEISPEEEHGHFQLWKYVGYLIGIPAEFLPNSKKEATEQFYLWTAIQPPADQDSVMLAKSLLDENLESTILKYQFQRKNLRYLHVAMNWFLLDDEVNHRLNIPTVTAKNIFPSFIKLQNKLFQTLYSREKQISIGGKAQEKVLEDYLRTAPRNTHG